MDTHLITVGAAAFGTIFSALLVGMGVRRILDARAGKFRFAVPLVWASAVLGFALAWFPGFNFGGYFGGAIMSAVAGLLGLPPAIPVAIGIALGVVVAMTALGLILPFIVAYLGMDEKRR